MLTIGSTPGPGALHLTQGVVRVGGGQCYIFYYLYTHTHTYIRIYIYAYLLLYLYICPRSTPILYHITHTFIAYIHIAHIWDEECAYVHTFSGNSNRHHYIKKKINLTLSCLSLNKALIFRYLYYLHKNKNNLRIQYLYKTFIL